MRHDRYTSRDRDGSLCLRVTQRSLFLWGAGCFSQHVHTQEKDDTNDQFVEKHMISMDLQHRECYLGEILQQLYHPNQNIWVILEPRKRVEAKTRDLLITSLTHEKQSTHLDQIWTPCWREAGFSSAQTRHSFNVIKGWSNVSHLMIGGCLWPQWPLTPVVWGGRV